MNENNVHKLEEMQESEVTSACKKNRLDLVILRSMAKKIYITLRALERPFEVAQPVAYSFDERRGRQHRLIIYAPQALLDEQSLYFVGFVSRRSRTVDPGMIAEIFRVDQRMLSEIARVPGLLSYSSLELHPGNWYNLVVFRDIAVKLHVKTLDTHRYAAHHLSPDYYEWIRLHNGTMPGGLVCQELCLNSTKYYHFSQSQQQPVVYETRCTDA